MDNWLPLLFAVLFLILIPLAPGVVRLRIRFCRWIRWEWAAKVLEDHFQAWRLFFRVAFSLIAAVFLYVGWAQ